MNQRVQKKKGFIPTQYTLTGAVSHVIDSKYIPGKPDQLIYDEWKSLGTNHNVMTEVGETEYHDRQWIDASTGFNWIALSESVLTPARANTVLAGEITTNGLARAQATVRSYNAATSTTTLTKTFTASGSFTSVLASGLFDASTAGIMAHIANFGTGSGLLQSGDNLAATWTATEGP